MHKWISSVSVWPSRIDTASKTAEIVSMPGKRTAEQVEELVQHYHAHGSATRRAFCESEGVSLTMLDYYLRRRATPQVRLARVKVTGEASGRCGGIRAGANKRAAHRKRVRRVGIRLWPSSSRLEDIRLGADSLSSALTPASAPRFEPTVKAKRLDQTVLKLHILMCRYEGQVSV